MTLNSLLAGDEKHHKQQAETDASRCIMLLILCLCARLCTMTPVEVEPASGTVFSASNTWRLGITSQLR